MNQSKITKQSFKGLPIRLHFSEDHFVYVIPGSWIITSKLSPIAQDLLITLVANMNDQNVIPVHAYFKSQFASNYNKTIATSTIDNSLQQLLKYGIIYRKMNGIYEISREYYIHKDGLKVS